GKKHPGVLSERLLHHFGGSGRREGEDDLVAISMDRPEVADLHLAVPRSVLLASRFDRGLIHGQNLALEHRGELRLVNRSEQLTRAVKELSQSRPAEMDSGRAQTLMLAVERQMIGHLVDQEASQKAHVGAALLQHGGRRRRAGEHAIALAL